MFTNPGTRDEKKQILLLPRASRAAKSPSDPAELTGKKDGGRRRDQTACFRRH